MSRVNLSVKIFRESTTLASKAIRDPYTERLTRNSKFPPPMPPTHHSLIECPRRVQADKPQHVEEIYTVGEYRIKRSKH